MNYIQLSAIILNWNAGAYLEQCLNSVIQAVGALSYEVIVVDNASSDNSVAIVESKFSQVKLIRSATNLGFGKGLNLGIQHANGQYIALLNPDLILSTDSLKELVEFLELHPLAGLTGPGIKTPDGRIQGKPRDLPNMWLPLKGRLSNSISRQPKKNDKEPVKCGYLHGSCMVVARKALEDIGGMPTATFMYGEEMLMGHRLLQSGYEVWFNPRIQVIHIDDVSADQRWQADEKVLAKKAAELIVMREIFSPPSFFVWNSLMLIRTFFKSLISPFRHPSARIPLAAIKIYFTAYITKKIGT